MKHEKKIKTIFFGFVYVLSLMPILAFFWVCFRLGTTSYRPAHIPSIVFKIADTVTGSLLGNPPKRVRFPTFREIDPKLGGVENPTKDQYLVSPLSIPTPYVHYAVAPGNSSYAKHNRQQFRHPVDLEKKAPGVFRIFLLGGSVAWGSFASDDEFTITAFMQDLLSNRKTKFEVINAGNQGFTSTDERIWLINRVMEFEPDLVISLTGVNELVSHFSTKIDLMNSTHNEGAYFLEGLRMYDSYNRKLENNSEVYIDFNKEYYRPDNFPRQSIRNYEVMARYLNANKIPFFLALQPLNMKESTFCDNYCGYIDNLKPGLLKLSRELSYFHVRDLSRLFENRTDLFVDSCHFKDAGNKIVAENLIDLVSGALPK